MSVSTIRKMGYGQLEFTPIGSAAEADMSLKIKDLLIARASSNDMQWFVERNQRFIFFIVKRIIIGYKFQLRDASFDMDDLMQIANLCFIKAAHQFDVEKGFQFSTYASKSILNGILMFFGKNNAAKHDVHFVSFDEMLNSNNDSNEGHDLYDLVPDKSFFSSSDYALLKVVLAEKMKKNAKRAKMLILALQGYSNNEIGEELGCTSTLVNKMLKKYPWMKRWEAGSTRRRKKESGVSASSKKEKENASNN